MRLSGDHLIEPDLLDHVDLHSVSPANLNSRLTDLGSGELLESRLGVYVHWTIPNFYRVGSAAAGEAAANPSDQAERKRQQGFPARSLNAPTNNAQSDVTGAPDFRPVPNRWIVTRRISDFKTDPRHPPKGEIPPFEAWVVESDCVRNLNTLNEKVDLEVDVSPFISVSPRDIDNSGNKVIEGQAETFIGYKLSLFDWDTTPTESFPHINLTTMSSSNPLFADFTQHNMNVFTIVDNFQYASLDGKAAYMQSATADYSAIGFHSSSDDDPMTTAPSSDPKAKVPTFADRLKACMMQLKDEVAGVDSNLLTDPPNARILWHGTMYEVKYDRSNPPGTVLANDAGVVLEQKQPVSIGSTPMDAILTYCRAHAATDSGDLLELDSDLHRIDVLLRETEADDVDGLQAAIDEKYELSFQKIDGGIAWIFKQQSEPGSAPPTVSADDISNLTAINAVQNCMDNLSRDVAKNKWCLFAEWWNFVSGFYEDRNADTYAGHIADFNQRLDKLVGDNGRLDELQAEFDKKKGKLHNAITQATPDRFYQRKDPTILFGNISKGWDSDFADNLNVRILSQCMAPPSPTAPGWETSADFFDTMVAVKKIPDGLGKGIRALLGEFLHLRKANHDETIIVDPPSVIPWYHDEKLQTRTNPATGKDYQTRAESRGRDLWNNTQPWRPIYVEWEAMYYHIPFETWNFKDYHRFWDYDEKVTVYHYGIDVDLGTTDLASDSADIRKVSGRNLLLPQATSTLGVTLDQIFKNTNPKILENQYSLPETERDNLLKIVADLNIVSFPLSGLTSHLLTLNDGSHVKPLVKFPNQTSVVIEEAAEASRGMMPKSMSPADKVNMAKTLIMRMDSATTLTPYGSIAIDQSPTPMKPVTHGQLVFTKLNIIDKFGQAIAVIDPGPHHGTTPTANLCLSDEYFPGTVNDADPAKPTTRPNILHPKPDLQIAQASDNACPFISLPPNINQPARLNAKFLCQDTATSPWRSITDWDTGLTTSPIVGWLVMNYADNGIQIFRGDGTFYREVRVGGRAGAVKEIKWLPFDPPGDLSQKVANNSVTQLDFFIDRLATPDDHTYLQGIFDMISQAMDPLEPGSTLPFAPKSYATYTSAVVGKPLALVNAGFSLELAGVENTNWSLFSPAEPPRSLLNSHDNGSQWPTPVPDPTNPKPNLNANPKGYAFAVKLGDFSRNFDGLIGYFLPLPNSTGNEADLDFTKIYTYFTHTLQTSTVPTPDPSPSQPPPKPSTDPRKAIAPNNFPLFTPYYLPPGFHGEPLPDHDAKLHRFGLLIDPFLSVHAYSAILPNKSLKLPDYLVEAALKRMTAFWRVGPILSASDVPATYSVSGRLEGDYSYDKGFVAGPAGGTAVPKVTLPIADPVGTQGGTQGAGWRFLQPYWVEKTEAQHDQPKPQPQPQPHPLARGGTAPVRSVADPTPPQKVMETKFNALAIDPHSAGGMEAAAMALQGGPYTLLEGYVQIAKPIVGAGSEVPTTDSPAKDKK